jgi:tRNA A37 threonylcarbamoyladenosine modification protein TsaB
MFLAIDPSDDNKISYYLFDDQKEISLTKQSKSSDFLSVLVDFLSEQNIELQEILGIVVVVGQGRFTSTRIATVIGNLFGFDLKIPLLSLEKFSLKNKKQIIEQLENTPKNKYISARYSGEPNIN